MHAEEGACARGGHAVNPALGSLCRVRARMAAVVQFAGSPRGLCILLPVRFAVALCCPCVHFVACAFCCGSPWGLAIRRRLLPCTAWCALCCCHPLADGLPVELAWPSSNHGSRVCAQLQQQCEGLWSWLGLAATMAARSVHNCSISACACGAVVRCRRNCSSSKLGKPLSVSRRCPARPYPTRTRSSGSPCRKQSHLRGHGRCWPRMRKASHSWTGVCMRACVCARVHASYFLELLPLQPGEASGKLVSGVLRWSYSPPGILLPGACLNSKTFTAQLLSY